MIAPDAAFYGRERARLLAAVVRAFGTHNLALAEDVVQETLARAFETWMYGGVPEHYSALLMTAAKNRALDVIRRDRTARKFAPAVEHAIQSEWTLRPTLDELFLPTALDDDELRTMFAVCHPRLAEEAHVALMLNILCGFSADEIARLYLVSTPAVEKRISRGKAVLAAANRLFEPIGADFEPRLASVRRALYLLFSEGYHGVSEEGVIREELCREALRVVRLLVGHAPAATPVTFALAALMCLHAARLPSRTNELGELLTLSDQDRSRWDTRLIAEGLALLERASTGTELSIYHVEAAIAGLHASAPSVAATRWDEIVRLYDVYMRIAPSPVIALNRAIAVAEHAGPASGLQALAAIDGADAKRLGAYPFYAAAHAELELRAGRPEVARTHFESALALARNAAQRAFLRKRLAAL